jgi:hypothetical protein
VKYWAKILSVFIFFSLIFLPKNTEARSGCCSHHGGVCGCDTSVGTQVCCDGSYSPSCGCTYISPKPVTPQFPDMNATWNWTPNSDKAFNLSVTLNDSSPTQYSAVINKCEGCDPGPLTDFYSNKFTFTNLKTGKYYLNVKKAIGGVWSTVSYWIIDIPEWTIPTPTVYPTVAVPYFNLNQNNSYQQKDNTAGNFILVVFLLAIGVGSILIGYKILKWIIRYAKEHDWVITLIFWIIFILIIIWLN